MATLQDMIAAIIFLGQMGFVLRFIICCIRESNQEAQDSATYKKQKRVCIVGFILLVCVYDIPAIIHKYFSGHPILHL